MSIEEEEKRARDGGPNSQLQKQKPFPTEIEENTMKIEEQNLELGDEGDLGSARSVSSYASNRPKENDVPR